MLLFWWLLLLRILLHQEPGTIAGLDVDIGGYQGATTTGEQGGAIGIPEGYVVPMAPHKGGAPGYQWSAVNTMRNPHPYVSGQEWKPQEASRKEILRMQAALVKLGFLKLNNVRPDGVWDNKSAAAYRTVLGIANAWGATAPDTIAILMQHPTLGEMQGEEVDQPQYYVTNPADIRKGFRGTAQELGVHGLDPQAFVDYYQGKEVAAQEAEHGLKEQNKEGTITRPPETSAAAEEYIKEQRPMDVAAFGAASRMLEFYSMLG